MKQEKAQFEAAAGEVSQLIPSDLPEIAFVGRSNVGKSSLINKLLNRKSLARISSQPGKTATINFYNIETLRLVDLPGYGFAKVSKQEKERWTWLIEGYFDSERDLRLVIQLIDSRHPPTEDDIIMLDYLSQMEIPHIIVLTKTDKLKKNALIERLKSFEYELDGASSIPFSAVTGAGVKEVTEIIDQVIL